MMGCVSHQSTRKEKEALAIQQLHEVNFQYPTTHNYLNLSGGEQQRVQLARVLAQVSSSTLGNKYLLLDEPTASLDIAREQQLMHIIQKLCEKGIGVLTIVHDINLAIQFADEFVLMKKGKVISQGDSKTVIRKEIIEEVYEHPIQLISTTSLAKPLVVPIPHQQVFHQANFSNQQQLVFQ